MNDKIKEILDKLKDDNWYDELDLTGDKWIELKQTETKQILDYITNLQQAIKDTKDTADDMLFELKQENERLKEENNNKAMNDYAHAIDESWYRELYDDYKSRCEKAIEYIEDRRERINPDKTIYVNGNDLLNILQNGRKDDKKTISKADFNKVWSESTTEDILNQFYYEHNDLREMLKENGNKEEVITKLTNNWNELEEWVSKHYVGTLGDSILDKMKEIKESNNV